MRQKKTYGWNSSYFGEAKPGSLKDVITQVTDRQNAIVGDKPPVADPITPEQVAAKEKFTKEEKYTVSIETNKNDKSDDGDGLDAVQPKAVKKKFKDRKDKDIDNDGDTDSTDKYLHKRRKAISKATSESLDDKDKPTVKKVISKLKGASQAHAGQAKDLEKAVSEEKDCGPGMYYCKASGTCKPLSMKKEAVMPDDKGEKINQMKHQLAKKGEKKPFDQLRKETEMSILLITHNLGIVAQYADRVAVMYSGKMVELASVEELFASPLHPYTRGLLNSLPKDGTKLKTIPGAVPHPAYLPKGCAFHPRCTEKVDQCTKMIPPLKPIDSNSLHQTACWLYETSPIV